MQCGTEGGDGVTVPGGGEDAPITDSNPNGGYGSIVAAGLAVSESVADAEVSEAEKAGVTV